MKTITPEEVLEKLDANEDLHIVDVRENEEVANGIIPGAIHIPLDVALAHVLISLVKVMM